MQYEMDNFYVQQIPAEFEIVFPVQGELEQAQQQDMPVGVPLFEAANLALEEVAVGAQQPEMIVVPELEPIPGQQVGEDLVQIAQAEVYYDEANIEPNATIVMTFVELDAKLVSLRYLRKLLSKEQHPPIQAIIDTGILATLVLLLQQRESEELVFEAAWVLTNIASGTSEQTRAVMDAGAVPVFIDLLTGPFRSAREQSVWALGNIAGDSSRSRDMLLGLSALPQLLTVQADFTDTPNVKLLHNLVWTISNLCRGKPVPALELVSPCLPFLHYCLHHTDVEVITDACWAVSYITDGPNERIQAVILADVIPRMVEILAGSPIPIPPDVKAKTDPKTPCLRAVGNCASGDATQTQYLIDLAVVPCLVQMAAEPSTKDRIKKEVCWTLSNITAGTISQIEVVIDSGALQVLAHIMSNGADTVRKEALWAISNITTSGTVDQILATCNVPGVVQGICTLLFESQDNRVIQVALEGLENINTHLHDYCVSQSNYTEYEKFLSCSEVLWNSPNKESFPVDFQERCTDLFDKVTAVANVRLVWRRRKHFVMFRHLLFHFLTKAAQDRKLCKESFADSNNNNNNNNIEVAMAGAGGAGEARQPRRALQVAHSQLAVSLGSMRCAYLISSFL